MSRMTVVAGQICCLFFLFSTDPATAQSQLRSYRNEAMRVLAFRPPGGWEMAPQSSYPRILASYSWKDGKLTLSGERVQKELTATALVEQSRSALMKQGFTHLSVQPDGDRVALDADLDSGKRFVRQLYIVENGVAYVLTLVAPVVDRGRSLADFQEAVRSLQLAPP